MQTHRILVFVPGLFLRRHTDSYTFIKTAPYSNFCPKNITLVKYSAFLHLLKCLDIELPFKMMSNVNRATLKNFGRNFKRPYLHNPYSQRSHILICWRRLNFRKRMTLVCGLQLSLLFFRRPENVEVPDWLWDGTQGVSKSTISKN